VWGKAFERHLEFQGARGCQGEGKKGKKKRNKKTQPRLRYQQGTKTKKRGYKSRIQKEGNTRGKGESAMGYGDGESTSPERKEAKGDLTVHQRAPVPRWEGFEGSVVTWKKRIGGRVREHRKKRVRLRGIPGSRNRKYVKREGRNKA